MKYVLEQVPLAPGVRAILSDLLAYVEAQISEIEGRKRPTQLTAL